MHASSGFILKELVHLQFHRNRHEEKCIYKQVGGGGIHILFI
jgi:hypothetical protein